MNGTISKLVMLLLCAAAFRSGASAEASRPKVLLELFTSQGCSSCPPADALLESYTRREDVIALSVPVDYWDRLGWKDTFASPDHTRRQYDYASARGDGQVYTPQVVVGGKLHVVGSSRSAIDQAIAAARTALRDTPVALDLRIDDDGLVVRVGSAPAGAPIANVRLLLAAVQDAGTVAIRRGENANRTVTYRNVVRSLKTIGAWTGTPATLRLPRSEVAAAGTQSVVVLLQNGTGGPILNAAQIRLPGQG